MHMKHSTHQSFQY